MSVRELPLTAAAAPARPREWHVAARRARLLSWLSLVWMGAEGAIALTAGILAGSIALVSFGLDSVIEGVASLVIVWRFAIPSSGIPTALEVTSAIPSQLVSGWSPARSVCVASKAT